MNTNYKLSLPNSVFLGLISLSLQIAYANKITTFESLKQNFPDKTLILVTDDGPPHMIANSNSGIDIDITKKVLSDLGYKVSIKFAPLTRGKLTVKQGKADLFLPTFYQVDSKDLFYSDAIINYQPTVFSLQKYGYRYKKLSEITGKRILSFQGATGYFGNEFINVTQKQDYSELHDMSKFPELLLKSRFDIVILDYYIFYFYLNRFCKSEVNYTELCNQKIKEHKLIPGVSAHVGFKNKQLRNKFNIQLSIFRRDGGDNNIIKQYIGRP